MIDTINAEITATLVNLVLLVVAAVLGMALSWIRKHATARQVATGMVIATAAVTATEQIAKQHGWQPEDKLASAMIQARRYAQDQGITFTEHQWTTMIERAVFELNSFRDAVIEIGIEKPQTGIDLQPQTS